MADGLTGVTGWSVLHRASLEATFPAEYAVVPALTPPPLLTPRHLATGVLEMSSSTKAAENSPTVQVGHRRQVGLITLLTINKLFGWSCSGRRMGALGSCWEVLHLLWGGASAVHQDV